MGFDRRVRARTASIARRRGTTITLRRVTTLDGPGPAAINPPNAAVLTVAANAVAGATSIALRARSLSGRLIPGDRFTVPSDATIYTVAAQAIAVNAQIGAAQFTPPLVADVAAGVSAHMIYAADKAVAARVEGFPERLIDGTLIRVGDLQVLIPGSELDEPPRLTDRLILDGIEKSIVTVTPVYAASQIAYWRIQAR
ncbi:hypothetical protein [Azospirillum sp. TSO5]|uniref:hypothetical protein n=1 Tax=Azospirillum sp. TSO5 TaxID=716760 RepID=UPI000D609123|nr:hypothetical protein [Azospirillum sp. TSO5]PWC95456.1 hypothetical protein TSO5_10550 [Azospirillum sp. TSO5]